MEEIKENIESQEMQENGMPKVESTFEELGVSGEILRAIREMGYETPMPVQEKVIPYLPVCPYCRRLTQPATKCRQSSWHLPVSCVCKSPTT